MCSEYVLIALGNPIIFLPFQPDMSVMEYLAKPEIIDDQHCELKHKMRPWWAQISICVNLSYKNYAECKVTKLILGFDMILGRTN